MTALMAIAVFISQSCNKIIKTFVYLIITLYMVMLSGARQAIFGFFIIIILRQVFLNKKNDEKNKSFSIGKIVCSVALLFFGLLILQNLDIGFLNETLESGDEGRQSLREAALALFIEHPFLGTGIGGFQHYTYMLYPHNFIYEVLCECGIVGMLFLIILVVNHFKTQKINILFLTSNNSFLFLIIIVIVVRAMVSADLSYSIELFSAVFACSAMPNQEKQQIK